MRFTAALIASAFSAVAVAQTTSASPSYSVDPAQASVVACLDKCADTDIDCLARCNPVPNPSEDQVIALDKCVGDCDQGDGSDADSKKYEECRASCIAEHYYNTSEGTPRATGAAGSSNGNSGSNNAQTTGTDSASGAGATGSSDSDDEDSSNNSDSDSATRTNGSGDETSGTGSGNAAQETTDSPDAASQLVGSGAALFALAAAVFAL